MAQDSEAVIDAARTLYAVAPEEFMTTRADLAKQARAAGDSAAATQIEKLRKPTVAAWIVNALVLDDPSVVDRLTDLGEQLREAQERLDAAKLRELTNERRRLVDDLARQAFSRAKKRQPPAGLRDEVAGTFEAAVADPDVAARMGRLSRAEQWSGFGFLPTGTPQLTVVRGGREAPAKKAAAPAAPRKSAAERRKEQKAVADAHRALDTAEAAFAEAKSGERDLSQRAKQLAKKLAKLQDQLDETRDALEAARKDVAAAKTERRDARSALDRAERAARD